MRARWPLFLLPAALSCNGTTGYELVSFYASASGPADAVAGKPYTFPVGPAQVTLTRAVLHVGAIYLDQSQPTSGAGAEPCTLPGAYVGEVRGGGDVNLLDARSQPLAVAGDGSTLPAALGQVWLTHGDVNAGSDPVPVLTLEGTFTLAGATRSFSAAITIDSSRQTQATSSALPGENPICQRRIVTPIPVSFTLSQGGTLALRMDPKGLFVDADLSQLPVAGSTATSSPCPTDVCFTNDDTNQPSYDLFKNLTSAGSVYQLSWRPAAK